MQLKKEGPLRVLAADDSAVMRGILRMMFDHRRESGLNPAMELCGVVRDGVECMEAVGLLDPDVLLLDLEMPRMDGLDVLRRLRSEQTGLPVIMCSSYTETGARATLDALAEGAIDYVTKPVKERDLASAMLSLSEQLWPRITALGQSRRGERGAGVPKRLSTDGMEAEREVKAVTIGVSTGGPSALEQVLPCLPADFPVPVLVVQHMPKLFTGALADRLNRCCSLQVEEAYDGAVVRAGSVWLAPGDAHMEVSRASSQGGGGGSSNVIRLHQEEPLHHCKPAVDYLFASAARVYGAGTLAVVMTGMGSDGLEGARRVRDAGGTVLAQDAATSAVWGMPGRVSEAGLASATVPLGALAGELVARTNVGRKPRPISRTVFEEDAVGTRREVLYGLL